MEHDERRLRPRGSDLIFLSEFPMGLLGERPPKDNPSLLVFKVGEKELTIRAAAGLGLPTPIETVVMICLLEETVLQGCPELVSFSRYRLMRRMGWHRNNDRYERFQLALDRLVGTTYFAVNHYPDPNGKQCIRRQAFHLLEAFDIHDSREEGAVLAPSWIQWSNEIRALLQTRQVKPLDVDQYLEFKSAITQALYRYLHTRNLNRKPQYAENLETLAFERLGLSRSYRWLSDLKRKLDVAHEELRDAGFLADVHYASMSSGIQEKVVYKFTGRGLPAALSLLAPAAAADPEPTPLLERLVAAGMTRSIAQERAAVAPEECALQLEYLPFRQARNPGGLLKQAIEEAWPPPEEWKAAQMKRRRPSKTKECAEEERLAEIQSAVDSPAFDAWWQELPETERETLIARAREELIGDSATIARHYERHPERLLEALRPILIQIIGWKG